MSTFLQDLRYGCRVLAQRPGFTLAALITLALGIGANATIFSLVNAVLLRPPPVEEPDRLAAVFTIPPDGEPTPSFSYPFYQELRDRNRVFSGLVAFSSIRVSVSAQNGEPELLSGELVSGNYFDVLGVKPILGRTFVTEEDRTPLTHPVVVLAHALWQSRFGADPGLIGASIRINGAAFTVVGVAPPRFLSALPGRASALWVPAMMQQIVRLPSAHHAGGTDDLLTRRGMSWLRIVGRLRSGATFAQANTEISSIAVAIATSVGRPAWPASVVPLTEATSLRREALPILTLLMAVVGLVLLIACANVANMMLARAAGRRREVGVRIALGAGRGRLVRQFLTESLLLAAWGGILGALAAMWSGAALKTLVLAAGFGTLDLSGDGRALGFTAAVTLGTGILVGLTPALQSARTDVLRALQSENTAIAGSRHRSRARSLLVGGQVALSLVLLIGAGLFLRTLSKAQAVNLGFETARVLALGVDVDLRRYSDERGMLFYRELLARISVLPDVRAASLARMAPFDGSSRETGILIEGRPPSAKPDDDFALIASNSIDPDFFRTLNLPLVRGREFTARDAVGAPLVAVVSDQAARTFWPGQDPLGKRIRMDHGEPPIEIVGVVRDAQYLAVREPPVPFLFLPLAQRYESGLSLLVRTDGRPAALVAPIRAAVHALDPNIPVANVRTLREAMTAYLAIEELIATLLACFGGLALALAAVGVASVVSYTVGQRTREIGVRMALGADRRDVVWLSLRDVVMVVGPGLACGAALAGALTRTVSGMLFGIAPLDPLVFFTTPLLLGTVAAFAAWLPARRAARIDPMVALRQM